MLDGTLAAMVGVAHESDRLVLPFGRDVVDGVLERPRHGTVVLGGDKDESVAVVNGCAECLYSSVIVFLVQHAWWRNAGEKGKIKICEVYNLGGHAFMLCSVLGNPRADAVANAPLTNTSNNNTNFHGFLLGNFDDVCSNYCGRTIFAIVATNFVISREKYDALGRYDVPVNWCFVVCLQ